MKARRELPTPLPPLYESDYYSWTLEQATLLRERRFAELDLANLVEEVEDLGRRYADELASRYETLLIHLLKWEFQPERRSDSWAGTIDHARVKIEDLLDDHPGLKPPCGALFGKAWKGARPGAIAETNLPRDHFPADNPYTLEQATEPEFWPGGQELPARKGTR